MSRRVVAMVVAVSACIMGSIGLRAQEAPVQPAPPRKVAALVADWFPGSHPDVIVSRILKTYTLDGKGRPSQLKLASVYRDKPTDRDVSAKLAAEYGFQISDSITDALTLGTGALAVDGVILSTEWAPYPVSPTGQTMYPHRQMFEEIVKVFKDSGRVVPVFVDKHVADTWEDSQWIYDTAKEMNIPLMAGSSVPVASRRPPVDVEADEPLREIVGLSYHTLDGYGFHGLEAVQTLAERRKGGETGIRSVQCLVGPAVWDAAGKLYDPELLDAALERLDRKLPEGKNIQDVVNQPVLFVMDHADGLRVSMFTLNGFVNQWAAAWRYEEGKIESTLFRLDERPPYMHFAYQMDGIEKMFLTGKPAWPAERTLLTSGALDALLISKKEGGKRLDTPYLTFAYEAYWRWQEPAQP